MTLMIAYKCSSCSREVGRIAGRNNQTVDAEGNHHTFRCPYSGDTATLIEMQTYLRLS